MLGAGSGAAVSSWEFAMTTAHAKHYSMPVPLSLKAAIQCGEYQADLLLLVPSDSSGICGLFLWGLSSLAMKFEWHTSDG